ncbi:MAG TPA: valine--tRNA ligase [Methanomassiliicoccales archaeon]|nr:valine--tRNA ligase [Methanomassiliicoccales archaeon]
MSYDPAVSEPKWQQKWKDWKIHQFDPKSDKAIYSVDNPPRYTSGSLHLGHATGYSLIDFAARYHRQRGYNVFFPLCFDVNGTPTEVKVEKKYGITKLSVPRQEYIKLCSEFANTFIAEMTRQFEVLGTCMDPSIYYQTDAPYYRRITQISFLRMLEKGLVYKGTAPVNWCPRCITALADAEVEYDTNVTKLNYIEFGWENSQEKVLIATTRPELLATCQLIAVHPEDQRYRNLIGEHLIVPIYDRKVRVVADAAVDPNFGTGVVMICTIGDKGDLEWLRKYSLVLEQAIDEQGRMTELAGKYAGLKVKEARAKVIEDLKAAGTIVKQEDLPQNVSICWRCHEPIEYLSRPQWFLRTIDFKQEVLRLADELNWFPEFMKVRLQDWVNSLGWDWVISRQRYFATPIPVWECSHCGEVVPAREADCYIDPTASKPPVENCPKCGGELKPCEDVFDTWMDSSISPLFNTGWMKDDKRFAKMYPMSLRPQSHDIIRTWAFYTILREHLLTGKRPWNDIMIHGFIMAPDGTPMHTSLNNVIDPMPILRTYGADAMRYYACTCALGEDNAFREKDVVHGKKFVTKLYNMGKFVGANVKTKPYLREDAKPVDKWMLSRFSKTLKQVTFYYDNYKFDRAMREIEQFAWHEFADHYLELVKHRAGDPKDESVRYTLYTVCLGIMKMLAPLLPHVTEEVYQENFVRLDKARSIHVSHWPVPMVYDNTSERKGVLAKDIASAVRNWKSERKLALNEPLASIELIGVDRELIEGTEKDITETVKAKELKIASKTDLEEIIVGVKPVLSKIGPTFKAQAREVTEAIKQMRAAEISELLGNGAISVPLSNGSNVKITAEFVEVQKQLTLHGQAVETIQLGDMLIAISK